MATLVMSRLDRPWGRSLVAYRVANIVDSASVATAVNQIDKILAASGYLPVEMRQVADDVQLKVLLLETVLDISPPMVIQVLISPTTYAVVSNHGFGDTSFTFALLRAIGTGRLDSALFFKRLSEWSLLRLGLKQLLTSPVQSVLSVAQAHRDRTSFSAASVQSYMPTFTYFHHYAIYREGDLDLLARRSGDGSGVTVLRNLLACIAEPLRLESTTPVSLMVDLRRYDRRMRGRIGNFVGAIQLPLGHWLGADGEVGVGVRMRLDDKQPLLAGALGFLRRYRAGKRLSQRRAHVTPNFSIHYSYSRQGPVDESINEFEFFTRPGPSTLSIRVVRDLARTLHVSINSTVDVNKSPSFERDLADALLKSRY